MKLLWLSPRWPLPAIDGARKATFHLLKELKRAGVAQVDLVCFSDGPKTNLEIEELKTSLNIDSLLVLEKELPRSLNRGVDYLVSKLNSLSQPYTMTPYSGEKAQTDFQNFVKANEMWDFTVHDGLHTAALTDSIVSQTLKTQLGQIIYRAHNVESDLWQQSEKRETNLLKKLVLGYECSLYQDLEERVSLESKLVATVSQIDAERFKSVYDSNLKTVSIPIGLPLPLEPIDLKPSECLKLLFIGRLDWEPNRRGLQWFLEKVWPKVTREANLHIVGSGDSSWLEKFARDSRIQISRSLTDLKPAYSESQLSLIPLFQGSGTRVKAIESGSLGRSFLSTAIGVEGLPYQDGVDYLRAETEAEWIRVLNTVSVADLTKLGKHVHQTTAKTFDETRVAEKFVNVLKSLLAETL